MIKDFLRRAAHNSVMAIARTAFILMLGLSQAFAIAMVVLVIVWTSQTLKGFAWDGSAKEFNFHPLCMVCGFLLMYGEAILSFRVFRNHQKRFLKIVHAVFHIIAFVAMVVGLKAVFDFHNFRKIANMYSVHSWVGMVTVLLFCLQYAVGFITLFYPKLQQSIRKSYMPIHRYFGLAIFFLAAVASISGINEKLLFTFPGYSNLPHGAVLGNCLGYVIIAFTVVVGFIVHNPDWKRQEDDEQREQPSVRYSQVSTQGTDDE